MNIFTIPLHRSFADSLAMGLADRYRRDPARLTRAVLLVPDEGAKRALSGAFARTQSGEPSLPRIVAIDSRDLEEFCLPDGPQEGLLPAVDSLERRLILARLIQNAGTPVDAFEAFRLATDLARRLDQFAEEEITPRALRQLLLDERLAENADRAVDLLSIVLDRWPAELARLGRTDIVERRGLLLDRLERNLRGEPPPNPICVAGVTWSAAPVARLLRAIAELPDGMVVLPWLDTRMGSEAWESLGSGTDSRIGPGPPAKELHPQFHLKVLLERIGMDRSEVRLWPRGSSRDSSAARTVAVSNALASPSHLESWEVLAPRDRRLTGIRALEAPTQGREALAISIALRESLETPGHTAALVSPDRNLAQRVAALCSRWGIQLTNPAGEPLSVRPAGIFLLALADAGARAFSPGSLLALLQHPLLRSQHADLDWTAGGQAFDRPAKEPQGWLPDEIADRVEICEFSGRKTRLMETAFWKRIEPALSHLRETFSRGPQPLAVFAAALRTAGHSLCGEELWSRPDGEAVADLLARLQTCSINGPAGFEPGALPRFLRGQMDEQFIPPSHPGHPRLALLESAEARFRSPDLMILSGLNEGSWPSEPDPEPWLSARLRDELRLPPRDRGSGRAVHAFCSMLGAPRVLLTRTRRDSSGPTRASRLWLRLEAITGGVTRAHELGRWALLLESGESAGA